MDRMKTFILSLCLIFTFFGCSFGEDLAQDISDQSFIFSLALINADGNVTSWNLEHEVGVSEANPLAKPFAKGETHYIYDVAGIGSAIIAHDLLKDFDKQIGLGDFGTKDLLTIGLIGMEKFRAL